MSQTSEHKSAHEDRVPFDLDRIGGHRALAELITAVLEAGEKAVDLYRSGAANRVQRKPDRSPVTEADQAVERHLRAFCQSRFEGVAFVGEEDGESGETDTEMRFIVDPIDGTRAFIRGMDTWSVLVGLEAAAPDAPQGAPRQPVVGIALMPATGDLFVAYAGGGAFDNGRPCRLSHVDTLEHAVLSHGGLNQFTDAGRGPLLLKMAEKSYTQRGFADFDGYRQLLRGRVDGMIDPGVTPWDLCPSAVLVTEAGGRFTDFRGRYSIHGGAGLASNGHIHGALLDLVRE